MKKKMRVGIIDSDEISQFVTRKIIEASGIPVIISTIASPDAIESAASENFDVVFIELNFMNDTFSGIGVLNKLKRAQVKPFTSVAVSVFLKENDKEKILKAGFDHCLLRPFKVDEIQNLLEQVSRIRPTKFPVLL